MTFLYRLLADARPSTDTRSLLSATTELSYVSHSFRRSLRRIARRKLIAGAIQAITF